MKFTSLAISAAAFSSCVAAQPHRAHRVRHVHPDKHEKRDAVVETIVDTVYAEATGVEVVVFVNQDGVPVSTMTEGLLESVKLWSTAFGARPQSTVVPKPESTYVSPDVIASTLAPAVENIQVAPSSAASVAPSSTPVVEVAASVATTPQVQVEVAAASSAAQVTAASSSSSSSSSGNGFGFSYSPYLANGNCKSQAEVDSDFATIGDGYSLVRIYGVDCNQTATVLSAAKAKGLKLFAGIYDITDLTGAVETIVAAANGDWSSFDTVSVGNEIVNGGGSAATVIAAIGTVRTLLTAAGYTGKVGTVDTLVAARANPGLCDASDVCTVNCHPFFDGNVAADGAGDFLETQIPTLRAVLSDQSQEIVITETGWPWKGDTNGLAVPSTANQEAAISSIRSKFASSPSSVILFTAFNDLWKTNNAAQFNAEQYWGFLGYAPSG